MYGDYSFVGTSIRDLLVEDDSSKHFPYGISPWVDPPRARPTMDASDTLETDYTITPPFD